MFKRASCEAELFESMSLQLEANATDYGFEKLAKAVDYLNVVGEILDEVGLEVEAEEIVVLLEKLAKKAPKKPVKKLVKKTEKSSDKSSKEDSSKKKSK